VLIPARGKAVVPTDLAIACPPGTYARIAPRSGLAVKHFIDTGAGVVDEDYRGAVGVVLFNHGPADFQGEHAVRISGRSILGAAACCTSLHCTLGSAALSKQT
jgi:dUTP pyrophosphatase